MSDTKQLGGLDYFKLLAALLVIAIHTSPLSSFSSNADFVFTRILARVAVPFFLMTTGYFLLPQYIFGRSRDTQSLGRFLKKTSLLYTISIVVYLPINLYAGHLNGIRFFDFIRMLVFDGTFYHLWYLPASILGVLIVFLMSRKIQFRVIVGIALVLYGCGLLGDSYFGFLENGSSFKELYEALFCVFSYTRNGIFYAPIFLAMGAGFKQIPQRINNRGIIGGFLISIVLMITEGFVLHRLNVQRHDSMYIALLPCMFFLFQLILSEKIGPSKSLRTISMWMYMIHPLFIVVVRGAAKIAHLESLLIDNSLVHYILVCFLSCFFAVMVEWLSSKKHRQPFYAGRAWIELDREKLCENVAALRSLLPPKCELMPVVKANAYGHGAVPIAKELNRLGISSFCVATVSEGVDLRRNGTKGEILVLGYTHPKQFSLLKKYHLTQTVIDSSYAKKLSAYGKKIKVHIKIDTGMHRLGERVEKRAEISSVFRCKNLVVTGTYTHLCSAETKSEKDAEITHQQAEAFYSMVADLEHQGYLCGKLHLLASDGLINFPELAGDYARVGIALYGVLSNRADLSNCPIALQPVLSVKARIALVKDLYAGESVGYGLQYVAEQDAKIAVLTIGYADGLPRNLSCGNGKVLIKQNEAPIIGRICMDQMLIDITAIPTVRSGDIAVIIGKSGDREITAYDLAEQSGTITNEMLSRLGSRLDRVLR